MPTSSFRVRAFASFPTAFAALAVWALVFPSTARADEIVTRHPDTCELVVIKAAEILPETWTEVEYRERLKGPTKKIGMPFVVEIRRDSGAKDKTNLEAAVQELERGNVADARTALKDLAGGGFSMKDGKRVFTSFMPKGAGTAKGKRPAWTAEYAHFYYAKALVLEGLKTKNEKLFEEALLVLDDVPNPAPPPPPEEAKPDAKDKDEPGTTGGFLGRFKGGNSRWIPEAMHLKALALLGLKKYAEAEAVWDDLFKQAVGASLSSRWVFEAKVGPGLIAEAQGDTDKAVQAYERAPTALDSMLQQATTRCMRLEIGRYFSQVRAKAAALLLHKAQNGGGPSAFVTLRTFLVEGQPEALQARFATKSADQLEALMAGARDPQVQAVAQTGLGLAYLNEQKYDEAILALQAVAVRYFAAREYAANALFHLAKAAEGAATAAKPAAKATYESIKADAVKKLKDEYPESPYATR